MDVDIVPPFYANDQLRDADVSPAVLTDSANELSISTSTIQQEHEDKPNASCARD
jgi:hypothetical protein